LQELFNRIIADSKNQGIPIEDISDVEVSEHQTVAGVIEREEDRRAFSLIGYYAGIIDKAYERALECQQNKDDAGVESALIEISEYDVLARIAKEAFWGCLRKQFDLQNKRTVGIAKDWQVTWSDHCCQRANRGLDIIIVGGSFPF